MFESQQAIVAREVAASAKAMEGLSLDFAGRESQFTAASEADAAGRQYGRFRGQVYATIRPIAQVLAGAKLKVGKVSRKPRRSQTRQVLPDWIKTIGDDVEEYDQHPILDRWHKPNRIDFAWTMIYKLVASLELTGWAYLWMPRTKGGIEFYHLPTHWVTPDHSERLFGGWSIRKFGNGQPTPIPAEEICPFFYPDPENPMAGLAPLEANSVAVAVDQYIERAQQTAFERGIFPKMAVRLGGKPGPNGTVHRPRATKKQIAQLRAAIDSRLLGVGRYGDYVVTDALIESIDPIGRTISEMDFVNSQKASGGRVARGHGVNQTVMGENEGVNYAQAYIGKENFYELAARPKAELLGLGLTAHVPARMGYRDGIVMWFECPEAKDPTVEQSRWKTALEYGTATLNDYNQNVLGLPWRPENEVYLRKQGTVTVIPGQAPEAAKPEPAPEPGARASKATAATDRATAFHRAKLDGQETEFFLAYFKGWLEKNTGEEQSMTSALRAWMEQQYDKAGIAIGREEGTDDPLTLARKITASLEWTAGLKSVSTAYILDAMAAGAVLELQAFGLTDEPVTTPAEAAKLLDLTVDLPQRVIDAIRAELAETMAQPYWAGTEETTVTNLASEIERGLAAGESMQEIARRVRTVLGPNEAAYRSKLIAQTEVTGAMNAGQQVSRDWLEDDGIIKGKEWSAAMDMKTRPDHFAADGQRVANRKQFVLQDGSRAMYPGDRSLPARQRCSCRCVAIAVTFFSDAKTAAAKAAALQIITKQHERP